MEIQIDKKQLAEVHAIFIGLPASVPKVITRACNKTMTGIRTDATQEIYNELNLTKTRIRKDFTIKNLTFLKLSGSIKSTGVPVGLMSFSNTRQIKKGVSVQVKRKGSRVVLKHAFIATQKRTDQSTYKNVYWRDFTGPRALKPRFMPLPSTKYGVLPMRFRMPGVGIKRLSGPRTQDIYAKASVQDKVLKLGEARLEKNLNHETDYELSRL